MLQRYIKETESTSHSAVAAIRVLTDILRESAGTTAATTACPRSLRAALFACALTRSGCVFVWLDGG